MRFLRTAMAVGLLVAPVAGSRAADLAPAAPPPAVPAPNPSTWQFTATIPLWASALTGNVGVGRLPTASVNASFGDLLSHLEGVFGGTFVAHNDTFILGTDFLWTKVGADVSFKANGDGPFANIRQGSSGSMTQDFAFVTAFAGYRLPVGAPNLDLYGTIGLRYQNLTADINLSHQFPGVLSTPPAGFTLSSRQTVNWVDPLIGFAANYRINDKWFVNAYADIGGTGAGSKLTTEDLLAVGYFWTKSISTELGFKVLYTDYQKSNNNGGSFRYETTLYGPYTGISYHF